MYKFAAIGSKLQPSNIAQFRNHLKNPENINLRHMGLCIKAFFVAMVVFLTSIPVASIATVEKLLTLHSIFSILGIISFAIMFVALVLALIFRKRSIEHDPCYSFDSEILRERNLVEALLGSTGVATEKLKLVLSTVEDHCQKRREDRRAFVEKVFDVWIGGIIVSFLPILLTAYLQNDYPTMECAGFLLVLAIPASMIAGALWDFYDNRLEAPLSKSEKLAVALKDYMIDPHPGTENESTTKTNDDTLAD